MKDSGFSIVDCDEISHSIMKYDKSLIAEVAKHFPSAIDKDGCVDRTELGKIVFGDKNKI